MLNQEQVETILKPHFPTLEQNIKSGFNDYIEKYDEVRHIHRPTTRANIIRDHIVDYVKQSFSNRESEGIEIKEKSNGLEFPIETEIITKHQRVRAKGSKENEKEAKKNESKS